MAVTMRDVARKAGVSPKTVSNVMNGYPYIREETRTKVLAAIDALGYRMNLSARHLKSGRTGVIGLAVPELSLPYFGELADQVIEAADEHGLTVMIEQTGADRDRELTVLHRPRGHLVDGLLYSPLGLGQDDIDQLKVNTPMVLLGERIFHSPVDHVMIDNVPATKAVVEHLLTLGRRRIAVLGVHPGEKVGTAAIRYGAYAETLAANGLPVPEELAFPAGRWHRSTGAEATERLLASGLQFDALLGLNDTLALGALRVLAQHGIRVPDDVAVAGFDNIDEASYSTPSLTTVDPGRTEIAKKAVDLLVRRMAGDDSDHEEIAARYELHTRESTLGLH
ncbi:LacI family DNA-binding transcriptional regulator [Kribbella sp. VKM Ac-2566]|uniref:LacI family DNA-binding transcriptional regulator n=1 Tax=Kribbella sp. VKM Ac-2566 TaxID=2512218 RepID=UPI0010643EA8|nr:LacI family DNA-binding transcriptional regulator [Kribbella sp. VKM Ac-2566]TDW98187.1 LacI family transcriptional regulator [Kribbella sp. VKM Ac-2566]